MVERPSSGGAGVADTGGNGITLLRGHMESMVPRGALFEGVVEHTDDQVGGEGHHSQSSRVYGTK
jgi:hypothetical protein